MADIRFITLQVNGTSAAEVNAHTVDVKSNGETAIGGGFILGVTTGVVTISIKASTVNPVAGHSIDLLALLMADEEVPLAFAHNGKFYVAPFKVTEASNKSEAKNGMVTGDFTFTQAGPALAI